MFFSKEMIDGADRDGDGEVNEHEFLRMMKKTYQWFHLPEAGILRQLFTTYLHTHTT